MSILEVKDICKTIKGKQILKNISFSVSYQQIVGVIGPNGTEIRYSMFSYS